MFKIDKKSWSFRFASLLSFNLNFMGDSSFKEPYPKDFCTYWRHVFIYSPLLLIFYLCTMVVTVAVSVLGIYTLFTEPLIVLIPLALILMLLAIAYFISTIIPDKVEDKVFNAVDYVVVKIGDKVFKENTKQPSLLKQKYLAIKNKYCPMMEYIDKK